MKINTIKITTLVFATFLVFATVETVAIGPTASTANAEGDALEVPLTGEAKARRTAETYETLAEISFLALVLIAFYILNTRKAKRV